MHYASANLVFEYSLYPKDIANTQAKLGCPVRGLTKKSFFEGFEPAELLLLSPGAGQSFDQCALWVCEAAYHSGCKAAGLLFNGKTPVIPIDSALSPEQMAQKLYASYQDSFEAEHQAYIKTPEYEQKQLARAVATKRNTALEKSSFADAMKILAQSPERADANPEFYKALCDWIAAADDNGIPTTGEHKDALFSALLNAGFASNEGVGNPEVKSKSDLRAYGRYCVGQLLDMGTSSTGAFNGPIHPMLGDWMAKLSTEPAFALAHNLSIKKKADASEPLAPPKLQNNLRSKPKMQKK